METETPLIRFSGATASSTKVETELIPPLMALPMAGNSYNAQRLSEPTKIDDTGDGKIDDRDGIFATCIAITDKNNIACKSAGINTA